MQIGHSNSFAASGSTQSASCPPWRAGGFTPQGSTTSSSDRFPYLGVGWQQVRMGPWVSLGAQSQFHFKVQNLIPVSTYREKNIPVRVSDLGLQTKEIWERSGGFCMKVRFFVVMKQVHRVENRSVHRRDTPVACKNSGNKIVLACHLLLLQFKTRAWSWKIKHPAKYL